MRSWRPIPAARYRRPAANVLPAAASGLSQRRRPRGSRAPGVRTRRSQASSASLRLRRTDPQLSVTRAQGLLLLFIAHGRYSVNQKARRLFKRRRAFMTCRGTTLVAADNFPNRLPGFRVSDPAAVGGLSRPITGASRTGVLNASSAALRSTGPLPGEFGCPIRCVAPTRSSLKQGANPTAPVLGVCSGCLIVGPYYMRRRSGCQPAAVTQPNEHRAAHVSPKIKFYKKFYKKPPDMIYKH